MFGSSPGVCFDDFGRHLGSLGAPYYDTALWVTPVASFCLIPGPIRTAHVPVFWMSGGCPLRTFWRIGRHLGNRAALYHDTAVWVALVGSLSLIPGFP